MTFEEPRSNSYERQSSALTLTTVGSGRVLRLDAPGLTTVLICFAQETQRGIEAVEEAVRARWPAAGDLLVAHVIDLHKIPGLFRKIAEGVLANEHRKAVEALPDGLSPDDHVVMLPDWRGEAATALGITDPTVSASCVILTPTGRIAATCALDEVDVLVAAVARALSAD